MRPERTPLSIFNSCSMAWLFFKQPLGQRRQWCLRPLSYVSSVKISSCLTRGMYSAKGGFFFGQHFECCISLCMSLGSLLLTIEPFFYLDVSENRGTPKSSILIGFSIINHPFWGTPIFGNTHLISNTSWQFSVMDLAWVESYPLDFPWIPGLWPSQNPFFARTKIAIPNAEEHTPDFNNQFVWCKSCANKIFLLILSDRLKHHLSNHQPNISWPKRYAK